MKKVGLFFVAAVLLMATMAMADTFSFTYASQNNDILGQGLLFATANGDGSFTAVGGTTTNNIGSFTLVLNPNGKAIKTDSSGLFNYDNQLFPQLDPVIDNDGLLFTNGDVTHTLLLNLFSDAASVYEAYTGAPGAGYPFHENVTFTLTSVPEPSTLLLLGAGLLGLAATRRKS